MAIFVITRERGPAWNWSLPMREQAEWEAHARFMDELQADGFILAGGPLGSEDGATRVMFAVSAPDAAAIEERMARDPWAPMELLRTLSIEPWTILLGGFRDATGSLHPHNR